MNSRKLRVICAAAALLLAAPLSMAQVKLRVAHALAPSEPIHKSVEGFAKAVTERTGGKVVVTVFPSEQLGPNKDVYEQVRQGAPIIQVADPGFMSDYVPDMGVMNGPYLTNDPRAFQALLDSDWYTEIQGQLKKAGFHALSFNYFFGSRNMLGSKPFRTPADVAGVTIRIAPNPMWLETFKAMGARGVPLPWTEVYSALSQGVVDAVEAPLGSLVGSKLQEQRKVLSITGHFTAYLGLVMNEKVFATLSPDVQKILVEESVKAGEAMSRATVENDKVLLESLKKQGVTVVTDVDIKAFRAATAPVYSAFPKWTPGLYLRVRKILDQPR